MHDMWVTLIPQLTKHIALLMPIALHLRAICPAACYHRWHCKWSCHITCMSFMDRALGEELWEAEVQIREDCLTLGIRVQATATQGNFVQHDANA